MSFGTVGRSCCVVDCDSRSSGDPRSYFKFPKDPIYADVFRTFSRRGSDYEVKPNTCICSYHFHPTALVRHKQHVLLGKHSVPTIFKRKNGVEVELTFDWSVMHYEDEDKLLKPVQDSGKILELLMATRAQRLKKVESLCCFCLSNDENLISIDNLEDYSIQPEDAFALVGLKMNQSYTNNDIACQGCMQTIVKFAVFKKRCGKSHSDLENELKEINLRINRLQGIPMDIDTDDNLDVDSSSDETYDDKVSVKVMPVLVAAKQVKKIEKEIARPSRLQQVSSDEENDALDIPQDSALMTSDDEILYANAVKQEAEDNENEYCDVREEFVDLKPVKQEPVKTEISDNDDNTQAQNDDDYFDGPAIIHVQRGAKVTYECFFCKLKFVGKATFRSHKCEVTELFCPVADCDKRFKKLCGFTGHMLHIHKLPKVTRKRCKSCNLSMVWNDEEFQEHFRQCQRESDLNSTSSCTICGKHFESIHAFSAHMKFHKDALKSYICDVCGKDFGTSSLMNSHKKTVHGPKKVLKASLICDLCGKSKTTKKHMGKHFRTVHIVNLMPCSVCGRICRNWTLLQSHMLCHNKAKKIYCCEQCPNRPTYATPAALRRHQESQHGLAPGYECNHCRSYYKTIKGHNEHMKNKHPNHYRPSN